MRQKFRLPNFPPFASLGASPQGAESPFDFPLQLRGIDGQELFLQVTDRDDSIGGGSAA